VSNQSSATITAPFASYSAFANAAPKLISYFPGYLPPALSQTLIATRTIIASYASTIPADRLPNSIVPMDAELFYGQTNRPAARRLQKALCQAGSRERAAAQLRAEPPRATAHRQAITAPAASSFLCDTPTEADSWLSSPAFSLAWRHRHQLSQLPCPPGLRPLAFSALP
jgi:hypothetical protein